MRTLRIAALLITCLWMLAPSAAACDLKASTNNTRAPGYIADVRTCLENLPDEFAFDALLEQENIVRVNKERQKRGLAPLLLRDDLRSPARWHSVDMAANNYFSHYEKAKRTHGDRISLLDRKLIYSVAIENIAFMRGGASLSQASESLHLGLMKSDSHREAILSEDITHMAVGVVRHENGIWLTQVFVNQIGEFVEPLPASVGAREDLRFQIEIPDWTPKGFEARQKEDSRRLTVARGGAALRVPEGIHGDFQLMIHSERANTALKSQDANMEYILKAKISGPIMSVAPDSYVLASQGFKSRPVTHPQRRIIRTVVSRNTRTIRIGAS